MAWKVGTAGDNNLGMTAWGHNNVPAAQPASSAWRSLVDFFSFSKPTTPVDRRLVLQVIGGTGMACTAGVALWDTILPKSIATLNAPTYQAADETRQVLAALQNPFDRALGETRQFQALHRQLFVRRVEVAWTVMVDEEYQDCEPNPSPRQICDKDTKGNSVNCHDDPGDTERCTTKTRRVPKRHSDSETLVIDQDIAWLSLDYQEGREERYEEVLGQIKPLEQDGLMKIEGAVAGLELAQLSDAEFAEHFGVHFDESQVSLGWQTAVALTLGLPLTAALIRYDAILDYFEGPRDSPNWDSRSRRATPQPTRSDGEEVENTRRAFFQCVAGAVAAALTVKNREDYRLRSKEICGDGVHKMRELIEHGNTWSAEHFFTHFFKTSPQDLIGELRDHRKRLRQVTVDQVSTSIRHGLKRLDDAENSLPEFGAYSIETLRKDDSFDPVAIGHYVAAAQRMADVLDEQVRHLEELFAHGIPETLVPAMKACYLTQEVRQIVNSQENKHLWGLTKDLGSTFGAMLGILFLSEVPGPHHRALYGLVQGVCDWMESRMLNASERIRRMRQAYPEAQLRPIYQSTELRHDIQEHIRLLTQSADDMVAAGIVNDPDLVFLNGFNEEQHQAFRDQVKNLKIDDVIRLYIDKALVYFSRKQMGAAGMLESISSRRRTFDSETRPSPEALQQKVLELAQNAEAGFIFDLIEGELVNDNHDDENWMTAEPSELPRYINYWADRIAGWFTSTQAMNADLGILPEAWATPDSDRPDFRVTREDVLQAFRQEIMDDLKEVGQREALKKEIHKTLNRRTRWDQGRGEREVTDEEVVQRVLLREIQAAIEGHGEWDLLVRHLPKLQQALQQAARNTTM